MNLSPWEKNEKINVTSVLVYNFTDHAKLGVDKISLSHTKEVPLGITKHLNTL